MSIKEPRKIQKADLREQIEDELLHYIRQMDFKISTKLPREEELARMLGVSRITLRSVLEEFAVKGMIFRKHGKGTFVNRNFFEMKVSFNPVMHFVDVIKQSGYEPKVEVIGRRVEKADRDISEKLQIEEHAPVYVFEKVFYADNQICAITRDYISQAYLGDFSEEEFLKCSESVYYLIYEKKAQKIGWNQVELNAVYSQECDWINAILEEKNISPRAFLLLQGVEFDYEEEPAILSLEYIDTSILKFSQIRKRIIQYDTLS